ncbi:hypothetical protein [Clostridium sp.]|uniref:phage tail protein n=1 Tax=Clostridium sp. TaxID=1506 RepID=UPI0025BE9AE8|nr:hypothetical protein [Clostridium sp.]
MSEANLEAFALSKGMNKSYSEMNEAEKATLRYNYMLKETSNIQGDFARNSGSFANQMSIAKLNMQDLSTEIGKILLPIAEEAMKKFNELGEKLKEALKSEEVQVKLRNLADEIVELISKVGDLALDSLPKLIDLFNWILDNGELIKGVIVGIVAVLMTLKAVSTISNIISILSNPINLIIIGIIALVSAIVYLWNTNEGFSSAIISCWNAIKDTALGVWDWLVNFFTVDIPSAWNILLEFFQGVPDWFSQLWDSVINTFLLWGENVGIFFSETIPMWISSIIEWFNELPYNIAFTLGTVLGNIIQWGLDIWTYLVENIPLWIQGISDWFAQLPIVIGQWLMNILLNIYQWGSELYSNAITWISNTVNNIISWFAQLPGSIWVWLVNVITNIYQWGSELYNNALTWVSNTISGIISWFASLPGNIAAWLSACISSIVSWGYNMVSNGANAARDMVSSIINIISGLPGRIYDIGSNIVQGLWNGIVSMGGWIKEKVNGFFSGIVDGVKSVLGIHSPSRVFRDDVGKYMAQGIGVGFVDESENMESEILGAVSNLTSNMRATVEFETSKTSLGMMSSLTDSGSNETTVDNNDNGVFIIKNYMDSDEISEYTYRKVDNKFALAGKKVR